ncbi:ABC transporter permease subunit [Halolamina litorea]|uniref:ABC transporter permease subunit n=1 Tax=Halolamina litorea TaxID=1515593 RepID=A0ABD6BMQ3_9EURY|nr:ABC transporter permease subunit [Halolamina litorea]
MRVRPVSVVAGREVRTLLRNRALLAVAAAFTVVVVGLGGASMGSPGGYVSLTYDLLLPVELLVPVVAFAVGFQSIRGDEERGTLSILRTYSVSRAEYVLGVFLGRALPAFVTVVAALGAAGVVASLGAPETSSFLATHSAGDTPLVYGRFVLFAGWYTLAAVAFVLATSALARTNREALATAVGAVVVVAFVTDLVLVALLTAGIVGDGIGALAGVAPASAFRGLVLELAIRPALAMTSGVATANPVVSAFGLVFWTAAALTVAAVAVWRPVER